METSSIADIDLRIKQLSYSSNLTLHNCPRKYQLYKLQADKDLEPDNSSSSITFSFGHIVGLGIQLTLESKLADVVLWEMFKMWKPDLFSVNEKQNKSFWLGIVAVQKFTAMYSSGFLKDWELVTYNGAPACELSFIIHLPNGFVYRGFVDAVLQNRITGEVRVLEVKTTSSANLNGAEYKNSSQAIGYSIVLDSIFPHLSSYQVLYLVYKTKAMDFETLPFPKSYLQRAQWIQELLLEVSTIELYEGVGVYPMHGESCYNFYRECEYLGVCTLATEHLTSPITPEHIEKIAVDNESYQIKLTLQDLINSQLSKESF